MKKQMIILDKEIELLRRDPFVKGVMLIGSVAYGSASDDSDLDILVLCNKNEFVTREENGITVEIHYSTYEKLNSKLDKIPMEVYKYLYSKIIFDDENNSFKILCEKALDIYESYSTDKELKDSIRYWLSTTKTKLISAINSNDEIKISYLLSTNTWKVLEGIWAIADKPMPPSSLAFFTQKDFQIPILNWFERLLCGDIFERAKIMIEIIDLICKKTINSHVILPKSILDRFSHRKKEGDYVYYLDLNDKKIKEKKSRLLGTLKYYYTDKIEDELDRKFESKIGEVIKDIEDSIFKNHQRELTDLDYIKIIRDFFKITKLRDPQFLEHFNKDISTKYNARINQNKVIEYNEVIEYFDEKKVYLIINTSKFGFVTSYTLAHPFIVNEGDVYFMVVSPKIAFAIHEQIKSDEIDVGFYDEQSVLRVNLLYYRLEKGRSNNFIVGLKDDLDRLTSQIEEDESWMYVNGNKIRVINE